MKDDQFWKSWKFFYGFPYPISQSLEYWLREILNMFGFVWVFTFYIGFGGEIFPFIFKLGGGGGGGANNSFLWRSKTRRHKEPFCLPNFGELAKANLSPQKFFIPPPSYLIAHSYISQVFPLACSFLGFHRLSKFLLWDIIIIFCHHLGFKNLSKAKKYPDFVFFIGGTSSISYFHHFQIWSVFHCCQMRLGKFKVTPQKKTPAATFSSTNQSTATFFFPHIRSLFTGTMCW